MNKKDATRTVSTGLTGATNKEILDSVIGQLSDGKWENSPGMNKYWENAAIDVRGDEIVILVNDENYRSGFAGRDEAWVLRKFAGWIKEIVLDELDSSWANGAEWDRTSTYNLDYLGCDKTPVTVADAYKAYDILKGRKTAKKLYGNDPKLLARKAKLDAKDAEIAKAEALVAKLKAERNAI